MSASSEVTTMRGSVLRAALLALAATALWAQEGSMSVDGGPLWKGFSVRFIARVEPPGSPAMEFGGAVIDPEVIGGGIAQRFIEDSVHKRSIGYDLRLEPSADGQSAQLRIEPDRKSTRLNSSHANISYAV